MHFDTIYKELIKESKGPDPRRFIAVGPSGFRRNTGIENAHKPDPRNDGPADSGLGIQIQNYKLIQFVLQVILADVKSGMELKKVLEYYGHLHFTYTSSKQEVEESERRKARIESKPKFNPASDLYVWLVERIKEYTEKAEEAKEQMEEEQPEIVNKIQLIIKQAAANFAKTVTHQTGEKYKSLEDLDKLLGVVRGEDQQQIVDFLKDIFRGGDNFKPLADLVQTQTAEGKDPLFALCTMYKTALHVSREQHLVGNPAATFAHITGTGKQITAIREPTVGRVAMKKKDPVLALVVHLIKKKRYAEAIANLHETQLSPAEKSAIADGIKHVENGDMNEADLIRPLYQM